MIARGERGQAVVETALLVPFLLMLVFGVVELGTALHETMTIAAATREGARMGGALVNGGGALGCGPGQSPQSSTVDPLVVAAIERVLTASGTQISLEDVSEIRIYRATPTGAESSGAVNRWTYARGGGPLVGGAALDFVEQSAEWLACSRSNAVPAESVGVTVRYVYRGRTPLRLFVPGLNSINVSDSTVMALNATR